MKNQKPIEYDVHLKYLCQQCGDPHWLSYKEASTKNFKIVCSCGNIFKVKRVVGFNLEYVAKSIPKPQPIIKENNHIPDKLLNETIKVLIPYGFTSSEAKSLIVASYQQSPNNDILSLVKQVLGSLRSTTNV